VSQSEFRIRQCLACEDRNLLLDFEGNLFAWGGNERGQLGHGTYEDDHVPRRIEGLRGLKVAQVAAGGDLNVVCTESGEGYVWPFFKNSQKVSRPQKMPFSEKVKIGRVACGFNFGFFISTQGLVYSFGRDNSEGQLGLGHIYPRDVPELIVCLKEAGERIDSLECGFRHAVARTTLGKVYTWGWGSRGQLGHGVFDSELSPRMLQLEKNRQKEKII